MKKSVELKNEIKSINGAISHLEIECGWSEEIESAIKVLNEKAMTLFLIAEQLEVIENDDTWNDIERAEYNRLVEIAEAA